MGTEKRRSWAPTIPEQLFDYHEDIRSAMIVDLVGNVVSFASRTRVPVEPDFVDDMTSKWTAVLGGILRGKREGLREAAMDSPQVQQTAHVWLAG